MTHVYNLIITILGNVLLVSIVVYLLAYRLMIYLIDISNDYFKCISINRMEHAH